MNWKRKAATTQTEWQSGWHITEQDGQRAGLFGQDTHLYVRDNQGEWHLANVSSMSIFWNSVAQSFMSVLITQIFSMARCLLLFTITELSPVTQMIQLDSIPEKSMPLVIKAPVGLERNASHDPFSSGVLYVVTGTPIFLRPASTLLFRFILSRRMTNASGLSRRM